MKKCNKWLEGIKMLTNYKQHCQSMVKKWLLGCLAFVVFANASESVCEKLKERDLVQNYLLTELFSNLAEYRHDYYKDIKLGIHNLCQRNRSKR